MSNIRYICLSDMHLGEEDSLLTNVTGPDRVDLKSPSPVMIHLEKCLRHLISQTNDEGKKPTLVLNGDILELALCTTEKSAMVFERFIELTMPAGGELFEKIIYMPGNHDHHFWETAREVQYADYIASNSEPGDDLEVPWHTTSMFVEDTPQPVVEYFLTKLVQRYPNLKASNFFIPIVYPNFGVLGGGEREKCVVFHHGHFIESMYQLMSKLKTIIFPESKMPEVTWDIEAENFAWIDFFWSTLGRSGEVGEDVELVYEKLQHPKQREKFVSDLSKSLADRYNIPNVPAWLEDDAFKFILESVVNRAFGERSQTGDPLSPESESGLWAYMAGPLKKQILIELEDHMPSDVTLIFGHTHKPFQEDMAFHGYQQEVNVYNTGGWIVESVKAEALRGGAAVLVDENLDATSLRLYNESDDREEYRVRVEEAGYSDVSNPFHQQISGLVDPDADPWKSFSTTVADEIHIRERNLRARINKKTH